MRWIVNEYHRCGKVIGKNGGIRAAAKICILPPFGGVEETIACGWLIK
jgi:hypothetical protein